MHVLGRLLTEVRRRGWPYYKTYLSRSPTVESLNSGSRRPLSILHHAKGTAAHGQLRDLAEEVLQDLGLTRRPVPERESAVLWGRPREAALRPALESLTSGILGALRRR